MKIVKRFIITIIYLLVPTGILFIILYINDHYHDWALPILPLLMIPLYLSIQEIVVIWTPDPNKSEVVKGD